MLLPDDATARLSTSGADERLIVRPRRRASWSLRAIVTAISIIAAASSLWQASVTQAALRLTRDQMRSSKEQQDAQLELARQQFDQQSSYTREQIDLFRRSLDAAQRNAEAASRSARLGMESADFARTSFQTSQRAFMILDHADLASKPQKGQPLKVTMFYKNVGLTPALRVNAGWRTWGTPFGITPLPRQAAPPVGNHTVGSGLSFEATDNSTISTEMVNMAADHIGELCLRVLSTMRTSSVYSTAQNGAQSG